MDLKHLLTSMTNTNYSRFILPLALGIILPFFTMGCGPSYGGKYGRNDSSKELEVNASHIMLVYTGLSQAGKIKSVTSDDKNTYIRGDLQWEERFDSKTAKHIHDFSIVISKATGVLTFSGTVGNSSKQTIFHSRRNPTLEDVVIGQNISFMLSPVGKKFEAGMAIIKKIEAEEREKIKVEEERLAEERREKEQKLYTTNEYVIKPGDTGTKLARVAGITKDHLEAANPGVDFMKLRVGQVIKLPHRNSP